MTCPELRGFNNKTINISFQDGEVVTARLTCLNDGCDEVLVDILITNTPGKYRDPHTCTYSVGASEIASVTEVQEPDTVGGLIPIEQATKTLLTAPGELSPATSLQEYPAAA